MALIISVEGFVTGMDDYGSNASARVVSVVWLTPEAEMTFIIEYCLF